MTTSHSSDFPATLPTVDGIEFRHISDFPGYAVGDDGSVWSCLQRFRGGGGFTSEWRKLNPVLRFGYPRVGLRKNGKLHWRVVHRLVLQAFVGECPSGMECLHGPDPDKLNNRLENLRWGTRHENAKDSIQQGLACRGSRVHTAKLTEADIPRIRELCGSGESRKSVAQSYGVSVAIINGVVSRKTWKHI